MSPSYMRLAIIKRIAASTKTRILTFHATLLLSESDWTNWLWVLGRQSRSAINGGAIAVDDVHFNICSAIRPRWRPLTFRAGKQTALSVGLFRHPTPSRFIAPFDVWHRRYAESPIDDASVSIYFAFIFPNINSTMSRAESQHHK